ncbi:MAG: hypothetical protein AAFR59_02780 [Bacteroidota bacterium]
MKTHSLAEWLYLLYPRRATEIKLMAYTFLELLFLEAIELYQQEIRYQGPVSRHQRRTQIFIRPGKRIKFYDYFHHQQLMVDQLWKVQPASFASYIGSIEKQLNEGEINDFRIDYVRKSLKEKRIIHGMPQLMASLGLRNSEWRQEVHRFRNYTKSLPLRDPRAWSSIFRELGPVAYILADDKYIGEDIYSSLQGHELPQLSCRESNWYSYPLGQDHEKSPIDFTFPDVNVPVMLSTFENTTPRMKKDDSYLYIDGSHDDYFDFD